MLKLGIILTAATVTVLVVEFFRLRRVAHARGAVQSSGDAGMSGAGLALLAPKWSASCFPLKLAV